VIAASVMICGMYFFMVFMFFLLSFSLRPTTPLESAQQFCFSQANTK
jgi:hypothetical protein